jgi:hypothetical protein
MSRKVFNFLGKLAISFQKKTRQLRPEYSSFNLIFRILAKFRTKENAGYGMCFEAILRALFFSSSFLGLQSAIAVRILCSFW